MNIADHLRPQDGQFSFDAKGRTIDIRVDYGSHGHRGDDSIRFIDRSRASRGLAEIGLLPESLKIYDSMLAAPYGMILSSGPTGSGKTTTLYACISSLDLMGRNVITIEDPAEYRFKNINQIQVNPQAGITLQLDYDQSCVLTPILSWLVKSVTARQRILRPRLH